MAFGKRVIGKKRRKKERWKREFGKDIYKRGRRLCENEIKG